MKLQVAFACRMRRPVESYRRHTILGPDMTRPPATERDPVAHASLRSCICTISIDPSGCIRAEFIPYAPFCGVVARGIRVSLA